MLQTINGISFAVSRNKIKKLSHTHTHINIFFCTDFCPLCCFLFYRMHFSAFYRFYAIPTHCHFLPKIYYAHISKCLRLISAQGAINGTGISTETHLCVRANCLILYVISTGSNFSKGREVVCV